ncbi:MAG: type II toxin-antitoxin system Phd/YefM family antitoxin [Chloroflexota bacterium]|nr:type II toxin-antitoxin system Phd/YefM family antitoxin [Chloroflexota bacterium]MDE2897951.1 type II toxin-antitoxin system Phd/YefM family antitoxin [Chloroflexota bacterium]
MKVFGYREATRNLAGVLESAQRDGAAMIRSRDGKSFVVQLEGARKSVLDVEGVDLCVTTNDIVATVREGRERHG